MRVRFTISSEVWQRALAYAECTNRTTSELICEALEQIMARYPKRHHSEKTDLDALALKVADIIAQKYPQVPLKPTS